MASGGRGRLEAALADLVRRVRWQQRRDASGDGAGLGPPLSAAAFRAVAEERLRHLEQQVREVKGRVNGLLFLLAGAVLTQFVLRLAGG